MNNVVCARIIIFGRSLGGAVAVDLATRYLINVLTEHKDMKSTDVLISISQQVAEQGKDCCGAT